MRLKLEKTPDRFLGFAHLVGITGRQKKKLNHTILLTFCFLRLRFTWKTLRKGTL